MGHGINFRFSIVLGGKLYLIVNLIEEFLLSDSKLVILSLCNPLNTGCQIA